MTRKQPTKLLNIEFDSKAPSLMLNKRQYAPTNSQNTFFHYDSFWTLIFPRNVTFREVDILRGYITIRMLQEIDGRVAFMAPNAVQIRNAHSYHKDYLQEKRLYESILKFIVDLDEWECEAKQLKDCFLQCIQMLVDKKHLIEAEIDFFHLWIRDLDAIGYKWPEKKTNTRSRLERKADVQSIYYKSIEQEHSSNSNDNEKSLVSKKSEESKITKIRSLCKFTTDKVIDVRQPDRINDIVIVTWITSLEDVELLVNVLNVHFRLVIGCFQSTLTGLNQINDFIVFNTTGGVVLIDSTDFKNCVYKAVNIGFSQNTFILAQNLNQFKFWQSEIKLKTILDAQQLQYFDLNAENVILF